ncbi:unnamed protein product [Withania somnifera]
MKVYSINSYVPKCVIKQGRNFVFETNDEEEYEEAGGGNRFLGFMFGNVDYSGDLDVDYLDEDAKEHLAALADKLGSSLTEIDLSVKSPQASADAAEEDYDEKAEDAVDYEDIDEQYEGPEVQTVTEEDLLLPKRDYFSTEVSLTTLENRASFFDDENYDEDDNEEEKEQEMVENAAEAQSTPGKGEYNNDASVIFHEKKVPEEVISTDAPESSEDLLEEESLALREPVDSQSALPLPVLCVEDGVAILKFSEIFALHKPRKKAEKRERRCSVPKDKYKAMDTLDIVEEDEVTLLRGSYQEFPWLRMTHVHQDSALTLLDSEPGMVQETDDSKPKIEKKDSCCSAEPMKESLSVDLSADWRSPICPEFYPLDQQDWEDRIIWDNSPPLSDNTAESCEISEPDYEASTDKQLDVEAESQSFQSEKEIEPHEKSHSSFFSCSVSVEPFGSKQPSGNLDISLSGGRYHPQLLRLESRLNADGQKSADTSKDGVTDETLSSDALRRFSKLTLQNRDILEESWVNNIIWEPDQPFPKPKLIYDLQDEQMLFEVLDHRDGQQLLDHAGAMITTGLIKQSNGDSAELYGLSGLSGRFNIANDKFYLNRKSTQQLKSHSKKRTAHGLKVLHSIPALKLQTMKAKLSNKDIANFHRPRALWHPHDNEVVLKEQRKLPTQGPMKIILKSLGGKGSKLHVAAEETISSLKSKASKKLDFKLSEPVKIIYCGKELEDDKSLSAQNVPPNSVLHLVRTRIHLLPRAQKLPGENKSLRPPGAFKKKSDLSVKDGHVFLMEYCEKRPLLLGNVGMGARLCTYYQKLSPNDQHGTLMRNENTGLGSVLTLDPADKSPFLGDIKPGCSQSSLETNMYRAPIFQQKVSSTDYLLLRSTKGKLSIRRIDRIDVVGQQEPHMEVISPGSKGVQTYIMNRLLVYMYREFRAIEKRGSRPFIRADELSAQFPSLSEAFLRKRLKHCADLQRRSNGQFQWVMRFNFRIPSEEELRRMVSPESVCAYESMQAGLYRLKRLGITRLTHPAGLSAAMNQLPDEAIALAAASHIERELQITPWNLSSNFVACTNQDRENIERLEITGVGDPSGRGLGFSYVRTTTKAPISNAISKKKAVVAKGSTVTGTDADLRRLSMEAAREVLLKFNVPEEQIAKLTRWHRIAMIRKLSSEQAASGVKVDPTTISKYARGQRMSFLQLQQQTREKCQEIWDRQVQNLSAVDGEENESDSEVNSDLDSFAGDLENLLDAEDFEDGEEGSHEPKHDNVDGVKGLKMRRRPFQAQMEEEIEDEAAEAAELCRMLMDEEKKDKAMGEQVGFMPDIRYRYVIEGTDRGKNLRYLPSQASSLMGQMRLISLEIRRRFGTKKVMVEAHEDDNSSSKAKVLKVKCGSTDKLPDKPTPATSVNSDLLVTSDAETITVPPPIKFNKIKFSNKMRAEDVSNEAHKSSILVKPPTETADSHRSKKIVIKQLKDSTSVDEGFLDGSSGMEFRKTKKINELSYLGQQEREHFYEEALVRKRMDEKRLWEEEERRRIAVRQRLERNNMIYEQQKALEEQEKLAAIESFQDAIRREREEEERLKEKKKKKKKPEIRDDYFDDFLPRRNDRRIPDRDRSVKRRQTFESGRHAKEHTPPTKRRRGGEVGLSNILEEIVETLKSNVDVSYLFLKPVPRKEAPDYHKYVKRPMDLSTIKERVRKLEYKNRGQFRHDVAQITINAHLYNDGRNPGIPPLADQLLEICDYLLEENDDILAEAESAI